MINMYNAVGFDAKREYYINDAGRQISLLGESVASRYMSLFGVDEPFPEEGYHGEYIVDIAKMIADNDGDNYKALAQAERAEKLGQIALQHMISSHQDIMAEYGVVFDNWFRETSLRETQAHIHILDYLKKNDLSYEDDGATWFRSKQYGDEKDRVLITSDGKPTYFLIDISYHKNKFDRGFSVIYDLWGPDHHGYIPRMKAAMEALGYDPEKFKVEIIQQVNLLRAGEVIKMSKRAGKIIEMREVIDEVGVDVARFFFINRRISSHLDFDIDLAKKQSDENPVYYLQYAHARICSILRFAEEQKIDMNESPDLTQLQEDEELELVKGLLQYPEVLISCVKSFEPHTLPTYLQNIAGLFHTFYHHHRVVTDDKALTLARLNLCKAARIILTNGFKILGISAPEKM